MQRTKISTRGHVHVNLAGHYSDMLQHGHISIKINLRAKAGQYIASRRNILSFQNTNTSTSGV